jgi:HEAT repeat protein
MLSSTLARADDAETLAKIDQQLAELQTFQYDRSGNALQDLERTIFQLPADSPLRSVVEQKLIDALGSANNVGCDVICQQLRVVGTDKCVPAVAPMLSDPDLSRCARYTLQGIGSPAALKAMHDALAKTSGALQVGLLNSLANRDYQPMRGDCVKLLGAADPEVVSAAVRALGRLGGAESVAVLADARGTAKGQLALDIDLALLNCAEMLLNDGNTDLAAQIYDTLYRPGGPLCLAGLRGLVIARPDKAADLLVSAIQQDDVQLAMSAINLTAQVKGEGATASFVALLDELPSTAKVVMLKQLGRRGDATAVPAVIKATTSETAAVRLAALAALGGLNGPAALDALLNAVVAGDDSGRQVARFSLARVEGVEPRLKEITRGSDDRLAVAAIKALALREAHDTTSLMLQLATDDRPTRRAAAIEALGVLAREDQIGSIMQLVVDPKATQDLPALEQSLGRVLIKIKEPAGRAIPLLNALSSAAPEVRPVLIRQLSKSGTAKALSAVRAALRSSHTATSDAAVEALAAWPNGDAGDDLIDLIENARTPELKAIALDGYLHIASSSDDSTAMFLDALNKVQSVNDRRRVLEEIGLKCDSLEAVGMTQSLLQQPELETAAAIATIRIAYKLRNSNRDTVRQALNNVLAKVDHPDVQKRAQDVLNDIDKYEDHIMQWVAVGPFVGERIISGEQSYKTVFAPEKSNAGDQDWKPLTQGIGSWDINLEATYGSLDHCAAYVRTMIWSPVDQDIQVEGGSDDALRIWVNGQLVHDQYSVHGAAPRQVSAPARLRQGWNELMLKVVDHEGGWVFGCRVRKPDGTKLADLKYEAR